MVTFNLLPILLFVVILAVAENNEEVENKDDVIALRANPEWKIQELFTMFSRNPTTVSGDGLNKIMDFVLKIIGGKIEKSSLQKIKFPNYQEDFGLTGKFIAYDGLFGDLSTLYRKEKTCPTFDSNGTTIQLQTVIGLNDTFVDFKHKLKVSLLSYQGDIHVDIEESNIAMKVNLNLNNNTFTMKLADLKVTTLSDIEVNVTGVEISKKIISAAVAVHIERSKRAIEGGIKDVLKKALNTLSVQF